MQTDKLQSAFDKYLPAVLNNGTVKTVAPQAKVLTESRTEVTGDKTAMQVSTQDTEASANVFELRKLAGLK